MKTWIDPEQVVTPAGLQEVVGGHPLVSEVLVRRGYIDLDAIQAFLDLASDIKLILDVFQITVVWERLYYLYRFFLQLGHFVLLSQVLWCLN